MGITFGHKNKKRVVLLIAGLLLIGSGMYYIIQPPISESCANLVHSTKSEINLLDRLDTKKKYKELKSKSHACTDSDYYVLRSVTNKDKLAQLSYYDFAAKLGYNIGQFSESEKDAKSGLEVLNMLKSSGYNTAELSQVEDNLNYIRANSYE